MSLHFLNTMLLKWVWYIFMWGSRDSFNSYFEESCCSYTQTQTPAVKVFLSYYCLIDAEAYKDHIGWTLFKANLIAAFTVGNINCLSLIFCAFLKTFILRKQMEKNLKNKAKSIS